MFTTISCFVGCFHSPFTTMCERAHEIASTRVRSLVRSFTHLLTLWTHWIIMNFSFAFQNLELFLSAHCSQPKLFCSLAPSLAFFYYFFPFIHSWSLRQNFESITRSYVYTSFSPIKIKRWACVRFCNDHFAFHTYWPRTHMPLNERHRNI